MTLTPKAVSLSCYGWSVIRASLADPDWFIVDDPQIVKTLAAVPSIRVRRGHWQIHRSHLPLLSNVIEALRLLAPPIADLRARTTIDDETRERGFVLRPHQHTGAEFIRGRRGTLLADDLRTGKTLTALAAHDPSEGPLLVVCPLIAREVWRRWIERMFPGEDVGVMTGKQYDAKIATKPIVICHYDILKHWQLSREYGLVVFDEAHALSNGRSNRSIAASFLASRALRVVATTGTPIWNRPIGLWAILGLIAPGGFGPYNLFGDRYCNPVATAYGTEYKGSSNEAELNQRLSTVRIRRVWGDVQADLPPITRDVAVAELSLAQHRAIDLAVAEVTSGTAASLARFRRALGAMKVKPTIEVCVRALDRGEPIVAWTWHKDTARKIADGLDGRALLIDGDVPPDKREAIFAKWNTSPIALALVMTISTGQVGIDLSHAHLGVFAEIDWTPAMIRQAEMRTYHPSRGMHITYVTADHLVERRMVMALHDKLVAAATLDADVGRDAIDILLTGLSNDPQTPDMERLARDLLSADFIS